MEEEPTEMEGRKAMGGFVAHTEQVVSVISPRGGGGAHRVRDRERDLSREAD